MTIRNRGIGWNAEVNLYWEISKQLERLIQVVNRAVDRSSLSQVVISIPNGGDTFDTYWDDPNNIELGYVSADWGGDYSAFLTSLGSFEIDWGDGTTETWDFISELGYFHTYVQGGDYTITVRSEYCIFDSPLITNVIRLISQKTINIKNHLITSENQNSILKRGISGFSNLTYINIQSVTGQMYFPSTESKVKFETIHSTVTLLCNSPIVNKIAESASIFDYPHGTCQHNDKFYLGMRGSPSQLVVFNNPDDLSDYDSVTTTGLDTIESMVYDDINNRIYATSWNQNDKLCILSINPLDITDYSVVYDSLAINGGASPAIVTDGTYIYGATYTSPGKLFKMRISDWTIVNTVTTPYNVFHAAKLQVYGDRTEMYVTSAELGQDAVFLKVNCSDLSYEALVLTGCKVATDDFAFKYINSQGGTAYIGFESSAVITEVITQTLTFTTYPAIVSYGTFMVGNDLYLLDGYDSPGKIIKYTKCDLSNPLTNSIMINKPNELFYSSDGKVFYSDWNITGKLVQFTMHS